MPSDVEDLADEAQEYIARVELLVAASERDALDATGEALPRGEGERARQARTQLAWASHLIVRIECDDPDGTVGIGHLIGYLAHVGRRAFARFGPDSITVAVRGWFDDPRAIDPYGEDGGR